MKTQFAIVAAVLLSLNSCSEGQPGKAELKPDKNGKVILSNKEWEEVLPEGSYKVLREKATERPYTGKLLNNHRKGIYECRGCGQPLFSSDTKFESNTGWPSFYQVIDRKNVDEQQETDGRTEVLCARCEGHLGHVFKDGPKPTGLRYCMNSLALQFDEKK